MKSINEIENMNNVELNAYKSALRQEIETIKIKQNPFRESYLKYKDLEYDIENKYNELQNIQKEIQNRCSHEKSTVISSYTTDYEGRTYCVVRCPICGVTWEDRVCCGNFPYPLDKNYKRDKTRYA